MSHLRNLFAFAAALTVGIFIGCGSPSAPCSSVNCAGCCDASGACQTSSNAQCGSAGNSCTACAAGTSCEFGVCRVPSNTGGGSGTTGGGTGTTGGGTASTGGGSASTGGGTGTTGGGTGTTGGGSATVGGGTGTTGGGAATVGGGTGTTGGGTGTVTLDAGMSTLTDGGTFVAPTVTLTFSPMCGTVTPCAGNEAGDWYYTTGCVDDAAFDRVAAAGQQFGCTTTISNKRGFLAGTLALSGGGTDVTRNVVGRVDFHASLTGGFCVQGCSFVPQAFPTVGASGTCAVVGAACECDISFNLNQSGSEPYTYSGGILTTSQTNDVFESCITEPSLQYRDRGDAGTIGVFGMSRVGAP